MSKIDWEWIERYANKEESKDGNRLFDKELAKAILHLKKKLNSMEK